MLNALKPGTVILYTGIKGSSETCIYMRELFEEYFDDENGNLTDAIDMVPRRVMLNIEKGQWCCLKGLDRVMAGENVKDGGV